MVGKDAMGDLVFDVPQSEFFAGHFPEIVGFDQMMDLFEMVRLLPANFFIKVDVGRHLVIIHLAKIMEQGRGKNSSQIDVYFAGFLASQSKQARKFAHFCRVDQKTMWPCMMLSKRSGPEFKPAELDGIAPSLILVILIENKINHSIAVTCPAHGFSQVVDALLRTDFGVWPDLSSFHYFPNEAWSLAICFHFESLGVLMWLNTSRRVK